MEQNTAPDTIAQANPADKKPASGIKAPGIFIKIFAFLAVIALLLAGGYFLIMRGGTIKAPEKFTQVWRLVPEKVSRSAQIKVFLPAGVTSGEIAQKAVFDPEIKGQWVSGKQGFLEIVGVAYGQTSENGFEYALFQPDKPLTAGLYYSVSVEVAAGKKISADFLAADDPKIDAIFPKGDMEAPEDSKISIVFNRPMVALSSADEMEPKNLPIEIIPPAQGRWKWISTNTLQYIPSQPLKLATDYTVKVNSGLASIDGLSVAPAENKFTTRKLRYLDENNQAKDPIVYNKPLSVYFNQPVDLQKTIAGIKLNYMGPVGQINAGAGSQIEFVAQYKKIDKKNTGKTVSQTGVFGRLSSFVAGITAGLFDSIPGIGSNNSDVDKSVIEIYAAKDKFGRVKTWDAGGAYRLAINKAFPDSGGITNDAVKEINFQTTGLIGNIGEVDGRSPYNDKDMFDPAGKMTVNFYEEVNLGASSISASIPVIKKEYGQKCSDPNFSLDDFNCQKIDDKTKLMLTFDKTKVSAGQTIDVSFDGIVNATGQKINPEALKVKLAVYPQLQFRLGSLELDRIALCSNSPLDAPEAKDIRSHLSANLDFETFSWMPSRKKTYETDSLPCALGEFVTQIGVGLMPKRDYRLELAVNDVFGQSASNAFDRKTGPMTSQSVEIFAMQSSYSVTTPDKTKLVYGSKNITDALVQICKMDALTFYREKQRLENWTESRKDPMPHGCLQTQQKQVSLPERYWLNNYFNIALTDGFEQPLGQYIVTISNPLYKDYQGNQDYLRSFLTVTNMAAAQKTVDPSTYIGSDETPLSQDQLAGFTNLYWVSDIKSLNAVSGVKVAVYNESAQKVLASGTTDDQGIAKLATVAGAGPTIVTNGEDSAIIARDESRVNYGYSANNVKKAYIYTDRPIYRPGDSVGIKGILRIGYDGNYQAWNSNQVNLEVKSPRWEVVWSKTVDLDDFGTVEALMPLDAATPLGTYRICVKDTYICGSFDVKEYSPASFKVDAKSGKDEYISKENINIDVDAQYYFGVPVANAKVEYTISSQNYYFDKYQDGNFDFGFYEDCATGYCYGDRFIGRGTLDLDANGKGTIGQMVDLQKLAEDAGFANSRIIVFDITAKNSMGQSVSTQKSVIVHAGDVYIGARTEPYFAAKNQEIKLVAKTVGTDGKVVNNAGQITATAYKTEWIYAKRLEAGGNYNYDWTKKRDAVKTVKLNGSGDYSEKLSLDKEGEYEIDFTLTKNGNTVMTRSNVYIYGEGIASIRPYNDTTLDIKAPKTDLDAGQTGQVIIESPFARAKALIAIERGKVFDYKIVDVVGSLYSYDFKASDDYAPNVYVSVLLQSADPMVKFGSMMFTVNSKRGKLDVQVVPEKKTYQPGEKVALNITARDGLGQPVAAEFSLAVVDVSVLALAGNPKKSPTLFFYDGFPLAVSTSSNIKNILQVQEIPTSKGGSGGGNDGSDTVRGDFRDTALWRGKVTTDSAGGAHVEFDLPDNLTTWQAEAVGVTKDTKLGAGYAEFMSRKDLMIVPLKPRFIIPGDSFFIGSQIFNQSTEQKKVNVEFASDTLKFVGKDRKLTVDLKAGESKTVYFGVEAPQEQNKGLHTFTISAKGTPETFADAVRLSIPVNPNLTYEATATAGHSTGNATEAIYLPGNVSRDRGGLTVNSSATLAVFLSDGLNYLVGYPYGCTEQISSRLKAMATVIAGLNIPNLEDKFQLNKVQVGTVEYSATELVNIGLAKVYNNQNSNGGFGLWSSSRENFYTTLEAVEMLLAVKKAGISINEISLGRAQKYLTDNVSREMERMSDDQVIAAASVLMAPGSNAGIAGLSDRLKSIINDNVRLQDRLSNKSLAKLAIIAANNDLGAGAANRVNTLLDNRIVIDSRGAFLPSGKNRFYDYFEDTTGDTALYLEALATAKRDTVYTDKVVRWILNSRDKNGAWGSTQGTLAVVRAFTGYLNWKKETEANFALATSFNGKNISTKDFNAQTILDQSTAEIGAKEFSVGANNFIEFAKTDKGLAGNGFYYDMGLKYYLSGVTGPRDEGFAVNRAFYALDDKTGKTPLAAAKAGDVVREHLEITIPQDRRNVSVEDFIPAGVEIVDLDLATEEKSLRFTETQVRYNNLDPDYKELRDDRALLFVSYLNAGTYEFDYYVRALAKGTYLQLPCVASEFYSPENFGRSASNYFEVK